jgi:MoxR-like ATPase
MQHIFTHYEQVKEVSRIAYSTQSSLLGLTSKMQMQIYGLSPRIGKRISQSEY